MSVSRREFLTGLGALGAVWFAGAAACREAADPGMTTHLPPESAAPPRVLKVLTAEQAKELEAIAARIIPTDDTPGAREAGVIWFIDYALGDFGKQDKELMLTGLAQLERDVAAAHPGQTMFSALTDDQQDAMLTVIEKSDTQGPFFGAVRFATLAGMFALPKYGGNVDYVGWELVGQDHVFEHKPPFGWYDRTENQQALLGRVL